MCLYSLWISNFTSDIQPHISDLQLCKWHLCRIIISHREKGQVIKPLFRREGLFSVRAISANSVFYVWHSVSHAAENASRLDPVAKHPTDPSPTTESETGWHSLQTWNTRPRSGAFTKGFSFGSSSDKRWNPNTDPSSHTEIYTEQQRH